MNLHAERLLNVARALREAPVPEAFTMRYFGYSCGTPTPACAVGHYAARADLQDVFQLVPLETDLIAARLAARLAVRDESGEWHLIGGGGQALRDAISHFGIDYGEWDTLFDQQGCGNAQTPEAAAEYIERFVAAKWPAVVEVTEAGAERVAERVPEEVYV